MKERNRKVFMRAASCWRIWSGGESFAPIWSVSTLHVISEISRFCRYFDKFCRQFSLQEVPVYYWFYPVRLAIWMFCPGLFQVFLGQYPQPQRQKRVILGKVCSHSVATGHLFQPFCVAKSGLSGPDSIWKLSRISLRPIILATLARISH